MALRVGTCRSGSSTVLAVYTGPSRLRSLRLIELNAFGCGEDSVVTFTARRGRNYWISVAGTGGTGAFRLRAERVAVPPNDDFIDAAPIRVGSSVVATTRHATRELGEPASTSRTVWFHFHVERARAVRIDACGGGDPPIPRVFTGRRVDRLTRVADPNWCALVLKARAGVTYRVMIDDTGSGRRFRLRLRTATPPANDDFAAATPITLGTSTPATLRDASREFGEPAEGYAYPVTAWFRLDLATPTKVALTGSCADSVFLTIYTGEELNRLTPVAGIPVNFCSEEVNLAPGVYSIQAQSASEPDFVLTAGAA
jgi:hypothetical protein